MGIPYTIYLYINEFKKLNEDARERDERYEMKKDEYYLDGYCDYQMKEIRIFIDKYCSEEYFSMTLRHELTHAFLYEIGNTNHDNEEFVDKISKWVPHINNLFDGAMEVIRDGVQHKD